MMEKYKEPFWNGIRPVFVMGIPRSGTTLIQSLLDGHPQLLVDVADAHFSRWYTQIYAWRFWLRCSDFDDQLDLAEEYMISYIFNQASPYYRGFLSHIPIDEIKCTFRELISISERKPKDFLEAYFHALGTASGALTDKTKYWVDKTLNNEYLFDRYRTWWPYAKFIFVIRDPRDVYSSYRNRDIKNSRKATGVDALAYVWHRSVRMVMKCQQVMSVQQYCVIKYEELVNTPEAVVGRLVDFLQIEAASSLFTPTKGMGKVTWGGNPESGKKEFGIYTSATGKWAKTLDAQDVQKVESLLHHEMEFIGYERTCSRRFYPVLMLRHRLRLFKYQVLELGL